MQKILACFFMASLLAILSTTVSAGKVYKWTDAAGNTVYSQTPPPSKNDVEEMNVKPSKPSTPPATPKSNTGSTSPGDKPQAEDKAADDTAKNEQEAKNEEIRKENCKRASTQLRTISDGGRIYEVNEQGERVYWDDETRKAKMEAAQKSVEEWCK